MAKNFDDWREQLREIDAELIAVLQRRMKLAIELLGMLRTEELTLGELEDDLDRLGIFLYVEIDDAAVGPLDKPALLEIFCRIVREQKRLAITNCKLQE